MERHDQPNESAQEIVPDYEAPVVEDLDTSHGPLVTPAGVTTTGSGGGTKAAPREL